MSKVTVTMRPTQEILARRGLDKCGRVQKYIDSEVLRLSAPYLPHDGGNLERNGRMSTEIGSGEVNYTAPQSRYLYHGKVMVGEQSRSAWAKPNEKKVVINKDINYQGGGKRGAYWLERMKADHKGDILRGAAEKAGGTAT